MTTLARFTLAVALALGLAAPARAGVFYGPANFDSATVGTIPAGWTNIGSAAFKVTTSGAISGSNAFGEDAPTGTDDVCLYTGHAATGNCEVYDEFTVVGTDATHFNMVGVVLRSDISYTDAYLFAVGISGNGGFNRKSSTGLTGLAMTGTVPSLTPGSRYSRWCRIKGNVLSASIVPLGTPKPATWQVTATDSGLQGHPGYAGLRAGGVGSTASVAVDNLSLDDLAPVITATPYVAPSGNSIVARYYADGQLVNVSALDEVGPQPTITINGGAPIALGPSFYGKGRPSTGPVAPYLPFTLTPLPATTPALRVFDTGVITGQSGFGAIVATSDSLSKRPFQSSIDGASITWKIEGNIPGDTVDVYVRWQADATLSNAARFQVAASDNTILGTYFVDQSVATPADATQGGFNFKKLNSSPIAITWPNLNSTVQLTSQGNKVAVDAVMVKRASADNSLVIGPSSAVAFSAPAGWVTIRDADGTDFPSPAFVTIACTNKSGGTLLPDLPTQSHSPAGFNLSPDDVGQQLYHADLYARAHLPYIGAATSDPVTYQPLTLAAQTITGTDIILTAGEGGDTGKGLRNAPNGYYTVQWASGPDSYGLVAKDPNTQVNEIVGLAGVRKRVFDCRGVAGLSTSPQIALTLTSSATISGGTYGWSTPPPQVLPPDPSDPTGLTPWQGAVPTWHPAYLAQIAVGKSTRLLDEMGSNAQFISGYDAAVYRNTVDAQVLKIEDAGADATNYFDTSIWCVAKITLTAPEPRLFEGCRIRLSGCGTITFSDATSMDSAALPIFAEGLLHVVSSTVFYVQVGAAGKTIVGTVAPSNGRLTATWGSMRPFPTYIARCNSTHSDLYLVIPTCATDDCVVQMAQAAAAQLDAGLKVRIEYSNEAWNPAFHNWYWMRTLSYRFQRQRGDAVPNDTNYVPGFVAEGKHRKDLFKATWTAAGRAAGDCIKVIGTCGGNPGGTTITIASEMVAQGSIDDLMVVGPYTDNSSVTCSNEPTLAKVLDPMVAPVCGDLLEMNIQHGGWGSLLFDAHQAYLDTHPELANVQIGAYELAWNSLVPFQSYANGVARTHQMEADPRMKRWTQGLLHHYEDHGNTISHLYSLSSIGAGVGPGTPAAWAVCIAFDQMPGTGNPTFDTLNAANYLAFDRIKSEKLGGIGAWNSLLSPAAPTNPAPFPRRPGHRAGSRSPN